jgi:hypothetical protein
MIDGLPVKRIISAEELRFFKQEIKYGKFD